MKIDVSRNACWTVFSRNPEKQRGSRTSNPRDSNPHIKSETDMATYILKRLLTIFPTLLLVSAVSFFVIQLQPGSFIDAYLEDPRFTKETAERIRVQAGLDKPLIVQYGNWIWGIVTRGDFGFSFVNNRSVTSLIGERLLYTIEIAALALVFSWLVAVPLGIYTAVRRNSPADATASLAGYIGLAVPDFLLALILVSIILKLGGSNVGGLFSKQFIDAPWSWAKLGDHLSHLWLPLLVLGPNHIATLQRQMRASMLDVLNQDYVRTAKAKGLTERVVIYRHAVRNAINPLVSIAGLQLPELINGTIIGSIVLGLPTIGPFLYDSLLNKDQYVVMTMLLLSSLLLMIGNLLADVTLAIVDPRIRYE
jgi:peptide/nickel transport system permease protein